MIYILFIIGIIICVYGRRLIKKEIRVHGEAFKEVISEQNKDNGEYIKLLTINTELKNQLDIIENNLNIILKETKGIKQINFNEKVQKRGSAELITKKESESLYKEKSNHPNYNEAANRIEKMAGENKSIEEMATELGMGKGEVLLLKRLLTK